MTKAELIEQMAKETNISKAAAGRALNSFTSNVAKTLKKGGKVTLFGFGTFSVTKRKARKGRNPQTGEIIKIKAGKSVRFKAGATLKNVLPVFPLSSSLTSTLQSPDGSFPPIGIVTVSFPSLAR